MPGLYVPGRLANRMIALTCASRVEPPDAGRGGAGSAKTQQLANRFLEWLDQAANEEDCIARRAALCMACEDDSDRARGRHLDMAGNTHNWLIDAASKVGEQTRWSGPGRWQREAG
jgi:hypothetical protein